MIHKGKVSTIADDGKTITATPYRGKTVTPSLVVPDSLIGALSVGAPVIYVTFEDNTGLVVSRVDGDCFSGVTVHGEDDAIVITTTYKNTVDSNTADDGGV